MGSSFSNSSQQKQSIYKINTKSDQILNGNYKKSKYQNYAKSAYLSKQFIYKHQEDDSYDVFFNQKNYMAYRKAQNTHQKDKAKKYEKWNPWEMMEKYNKIQFSPSYGKKLDPIQQKGKFSPNNSIQDKYEGNYMPSHNQQQGDPYSAILKQQLNPQILEGSNIHQKQRISQNYASQQKILYKKDLQDLELEKYKLKDDGVSKKDKEFLAFSIKKYDQFKKQQKVSCSSIQRKKILKCIGKIIAVYEQKQRKPINGRQLPSDKQIIKTGTGFIVGHNLLLTAGHLLYWKSQNQSPIQVFFHPQGQDKNCILQIRAEKIHVHNHYIQIPIQEEICKRYDMGIILLEQNQYYDQNTFISIQWQYKKWNTQYSQKFKIFGYPEVSFEQEYLYQIKSQETNARRQSDYIYYEPSVTNSGCSGGPLIIVKNLKNGEVQYKIIGIHLGKKGNFAYGMDFNHSKQFFLEILEQHGYESLYKDYHPSNKNFLSYFNKAKQNKNNFIDNLLSLFKQDQTQKLTKKLLESQQTIKKLQQKLLQLQTQKTLQKQKLFSKKDQNQNLLKINVLQSKNQIKMEEEYEFPYIDALVSKLNEDPANLKDTIKKQYYNNEDLLKINKEIQQYKKKMKSFQKQKLQLNQVKIKLSQFQQKINQLKAKNLTLQTINQNLYQNSIEKYISYLKTTKNYQNHYSSYFYKKVTEQQKKHYQSKYNIALTLNSYILNHQNIPINIQTIFKFNWKSLQFLMLTSCKITQQQWIIFSKKGVLFPSLKILLLNDNKIKKIHQFDIQSFQFLLYLNLEYNNLDDKSIKYLTQLKNKHPTKYLIFSRQL